MESAVNSPNQDSATVNVEHDIAELVDGSVFPHLQKLVADPKALKRKAILNDARDMAYYRSISHQLNHFLGGCISILYRKVISHDIASKVADLVANEVNVRFGGSPVALTDEELKRLEVAFMATESVGDASDNFEKYLWSCWYEYNPRELYDRHERQMKVLYICARSRESTGVPKATRKLRDWLFVKNDYRGTKICARLMAIYRYAEAHWDDVQRDWTNLFTDSDADAAVREKLQKFTDESETEKPRSLSKEKDADEPIVVVVVDEASSLLGMGYDKTNYVHLLQDALGLATDDLHTSGGLCGVLLDADPAIADVNLPVSTKLGLEPPNPFQDPDLASFPPFALSRTVGVHWQKHCTGVYQQSGGKEGVGDEDDGIGVGDTIDGGKVKTQVVAYKTAVTGSESAALEALTRMGRPLWSSVLNSPMEENGVERPTTRGDVINLAAQKLLLGCTVVRGSYNELTLSGVASLLCRLGLRPHCSLALASRSVVDLMAVLAYVNFEKDGCLSTYASDPVLTLGATRVWYAVDAALSRYLLPQLKRMLLDESLEIGDKGQVVARLLLLLAMDKCVVGDTKPSECEFVGQFIPVQTFMDVLGVADLPIKCKGMTAASEATKTAFNEWRSQWEGWHMGFTHFVQLEGEPNEETLWVLLGRRAAGVLPRSQKGANLLIPTFKKKDSTAEAKVNSPIDSEAKVGVILIQLTSRSPRDCESATEKLSVVRSDGRSEIIRMYMNPGVSGSTADTKTTATSEDAFALCFHSVSCVTYPFLEEGVATQLAGLLTSRWDPMASVDGGLEHRNEAELEWGEEENEAALSVVMPDEEFKGDCISSPCPRTRPQQGDRGDP
uniref:Uncharacterized protein n=1 Tax=Phytophthora ramorum TaxID=164328 RepID=H3GN26_PHYRM